MKRVEHWQVLLISLWAVVVLITMFLLAQKKQVSFDPDNRLQLASMSLKFEANVTGHFRNIVDQQEGHIVHITDDGCHCNYLSQSHQDQLDKLFLANNFSVQKLDISEYPALSSVIPSIPAIIIFDKKGKLGYLGPYSSGFFCNPKTSIIETIADSIIHNRHVGPMIISDSKGCYCHT